MSHVHVPVPAYLNLHCMLIIKTDGKNLPNNSSYYIKKGSYNKSQN